MSFWKTPNENEFLILCCMVPTKWLIFDLILIHYDEVECKSV